MRFHLKKYVYRWLWKWCVENPKSIVIFLLFFLHFCVMEEFLANGCEMRCKQHEDVIYIFIRGRHMLFCTWVVRLARRRIIITYFCITPLNKGSGMGYGNVSYKIFYKRWMDSKAEFHVVDVSLKGGRPKLYYNLQFISIICKWQKKNI